MFDGGSWSYGPELPEPRFDHCIQSFQNSKIMVFGGYEAGGPSPSFYIHSTYEYDFALPERGWVQRDDIPQPSRGAACGHVR